MAATFVQFPVFRRSSSQTQFPFLLPLAMFLLVVLPSASLANPVGAQQKVGGGPVENGDVEQRELLALRELLERRENEIQRQLLQQQMQQQQPPVYPEPQQYFVKDIPMEEAEMDEEMAQSDKAKRAQTFVRFGKRAQSFVRFGKRAQTFVRFGKRAQTFVRLGRDVQNQQQEQKEAN